ncbi:MAG: hypothetical protein AAGD43_05675 [Pseudomonadota bacterium]
MKTLILIAGTAGMSVALVLAAPGVPLVSSTALAKGNKSCCKSERRKCDAFCATLDKSGARYPRCKRACKVRTFNCYRTGFYYWRNSPTANCKAS